MTTSSSKAVAEKSVSENSLAEEQKEAAAVSAPEVGNNGAGGEVIEAGPRNSDANIAEQKPKDIGSSPKSEGDGKPSAGDKEKEVRKHPLTWERTIEIAKLVATVWVALVGSMVTMQFNERQHELNRIEAIAKMLPHVASKPSSTSEEEPSAQAQPESQDPEVRTREAIRRAFKKYDHKQAHGQGRLDPNERDMGRDGAIWAIFRTANNRVMLRDLAALFPDDIYRVVSSIAIAGQLDKDDDALVALQVSSEKLAAKYTNDPKDAELASRLYAQALRLKERKPSDQSPMHVIDLTTEMVSVPASDEQFSHLVKSINDLADLHLDESDDAQTSNAGHWEAKDLYKRARQIGLQHNDNTQVVIQVARADIALADIYASEHVLTDAATYLREAHRLEDKISGKEHVDPLRKLDTDKDGFAGLAEISQSVGEARDRLLRIEKEFPSKGVPLE